MAWPAHSVMCRSWLTAVLILSLGRAVAAEPDGELAATREVQFNHSAPYSSKGEVHRRFGSSEPGSDYQIGNERFTLIVPETYATNAGWGLLVWVSPGGPVRLPADWEPELARHRLILVAANHAGNDRAMTDRLRLALDATFNTCRRYPVDRKRIYVGGMSGGARVASELGVGCADVFTGTLCVCGVNFYTDMPGPGDTYIPASYRPDPRLLTLAKSHGRFVLLTGELDFNRSNTQDVLAKGFTPAGFKNVLYLEVAGMKHAMPGAEVLKTSLDYLDGGAGRATNTPAGR